MMEFRIHTSRLAALISLAVAMSAQALGAAPAWSPASSPAAQVPGYFRTQVGAFELTALYDGYVDIDAGLLDGASKTTIEQSLRRVFLSRTRPVQTAVNAYLVRTGKHVILVDTGTAKLFGDQLGFLLQNLQAAGFAPQDVDTILLTHLHPDHAGGLLTADGRMAFPNAQVFVPQADADYWLSNTEAARAPKDKQALFGMSRDAVAPYQAAGRLVVFAPGQALREGVSAVAAPGHTPGHTAYMFTSQAQRLLVWGDIVHNAAVQFPHPEVAIEYDWNKQGAIATRRTLLSLAASGQLLVAGAHLPFPGLGRIARDTSRDYRWVPVEYGPVRSRP